MLNGSLIGFGRMGITHYSILNTHPAIKFTSVCDSSGRMLKVISKYQRLRVFDNYLEMMDKMAPDFVLISTPTGHHAAQVKEAVRRGIHVFVEKPFTLSGEQGKEVLEALDACPVVNQVGYVNRYNDIFLLVRELVRSGDIGRVISFKVEIHSPTVLKGSGAGWRDSRNQGGGCLYDMASHGIDLVNYIIGKPDQVAGSVMRSIYSKGVEDLVASTFLYGDGAFGSLLVNWSDASYRKPAYKFEVFGNKGRIIADHHEAKVFFKDQPERIGYNQGWNVRYVTDVVEPVRFYLRGYEFTRQLDSFVDEILGKSGQNRCSFHDGFETDQVIDMIVNDASKRV